MPFQEQMSDLTKSLQQIGDDIKEQGVKYQKQLEQHGVVNEELRKSVDTALSQQGALQQRLQALEQAQVAATQTPELTVTTAGEILVQHDSFSNVHSSWKGSASVSVPKSALTSLPTSGGALVAKDRRGMLDPIRTRLTVRDLLLPGSTASNAIEYPQETGFDNQADVVAEGATANYSEITTNLVTANVRTIAHLLKVSKQMLDDAPALSSYIDMRMGDGLVLAEEKQFLFGDGTGQNLKGLVPQASDFSAEFEPEDMNGIDRLRLALLQAELAEVPSDGIVLSLIDWAVLELLKDKQGRYLIGQAANGAIKQLWNRPVVETLAMTRNRFLVGAFKQAQIFDRQDATITLSTENADDFEKGLATVRGEERLALAVYRPEGFVVGDLKPAASAGP